VSASSRGGFTLVELLIAVTMISVGILALMQSSAGITTMIRDGRDRTRAVSIATTRLETLRQQALNSNPGCTALANGSAAAAGGLSEQWVVSGTGWRRQLAVTVAYTGPRRSNAITVRTSVLCQ